MQQRRLFVRLKCKVSLYLGSFSLHQVRLRQSLLFKLDQLLATVLIHTRVVFWNNITRVIGQVTTQIFIKGLNWFWLALWRSYSIRLLCMDAFYDSSWLNSQLISFLKFLSLSACSLRRWTGFFGSLYLFNQHKVLQNRRQLIRLPLWILLC